MVALSLLLRGGRIVDGTGSPSCVGDIAISGDRIVEIAYAGELTSANAEREINAEGLIVAPGFIDTHTHDDRAVLIDPQMTCKLSQGVTTVITGNCGLGTFPVVHKLPVSNRVMAFEVTSSLNPPQHLFLSTKTKLSQ